MEQIRRGTFRKNLKYGKKSKHLSIKLEQWLWNATFDYALRNDVNISDVVTKDILFRVLLDNCDGGGATPWVEPECLESPDFRILIDHLKKKFDKPPLRIVGGTDI